MRRREAGRLKNEFWQSTAKYFDRLHDQNEKFQKWNSPEMAQKSEEAYKKSKLAESRRANLLSRRAKLRAMLEKEEREYLDQMRQLPPGKKRQSFKDVKAEYEQMKERRMQEQQKEAEEKMLQHWKINNPDFRELQCKKRYEMVQKAWGEQKLEKEAKEEAEHRIEEIRLRVEAEKAFRQEEEAKDKERKREQQVAEWKQTILKQIEELRARRREEESIKREIGEEQERQKQMEDAEIKRQKIEEKRKVLDLREYLRRQHRLKLLAKTQMVQKELDEDKRLLEDLEAFSKTHEQESIRDREVKNQRLTWMKDVLLQQKLAEEKRQKEMEMLFSEEAEKMWNKQEAVWKREKEARKNLMDDVFAGLIEQIRVKLQEKERQQELVSTERLKIEEGIDRLTNDIQKEEKEASQKKAMFVEDLDHQVKEKKEKITREQRFRDTNELAKTLADWKVSPDEPVISDFRRRRAKWT